MFGLLTPKHRIYGAWCRCSTTVRYPRLPMPVCRDFLDVNYGWLQSKFLPLAYPNIRSVILVGIVDLVGLPMVLCAEALAIMRAFRVVLMYYPHWRKSWGRIPKERVILRATLWAYVLMEILVWSAAVAFGIPR